MRFYCSSKSDRDETPRENVFLLFPRGRASSCEVALAVRDFKNRRIARTTNRVTFHSFATSPYLCIIVYSSLLFITVVPYLIVTFTHANASFYVYSYIYISYVLFIKTICFHTYYFYSRTRVHNCVRLY